MHSPRELNVDCVHCGQYSPTDAELKSIYWHAPDATTCPRCDDEAHFLINGRRAVNATEIRDAICQMIETH